MSPEGIMVTLAILLISLLILGLPVAFITGGIGVTLLTWLYGFDYLTSVITNTLKGNASFLMTAIPIFVLMGSILESSGIAEDLYTALHAWVSGIRGGLAMGTVVICAIFAAMVGVAGAEIVVMGLVALPNMLKYKYDKKMVLGTICAAGSLGPLIPPSVLFIIYGAEAGVSIGALFKGGLPAGIFLAILYIIYIAIRSFIQKDLCPVVPVEDRPGLMGKILAIKALAMPAFLIFIVLGSIFSGIATPSEAASVGAVGAALCALIKKRLNWIMIKKALITTLKTNCMVMWVITGAKCYAAVMISTGGIDVIKELMLSLSLSPYWTILLMMAIVFILGCFIDTVTIIIICVPIFSPIVKILGVDPVWFGVLFVVNLQLGYITPPFGYSLFYLKGVAPKDISLSDIYNSVLPYVLVEILGLYLMVQFPGLITWIL